MNIDYLDLVLSACFSLRKIKTITIQEDDKEFKLRPQLHIIIISPFGTFKSSLTRGFEHKQAKNICLVDDFSKPGIEGTISKEGEYIPPLLARLGGKVMVIDEWNNIDGYARDALLSVLENQRFSRTLGFKVKKPFNYKCKYGRIDIYDNNIEGEMLFSCIAYSMEYPIQSQKDKALLSRFSPLFIEPTLEYMKAHTSGKFKVNIKDVSAQVEDIIISKEAYEIFHEAFYEYVVKEKLVPDDSDEYGYISRAMSDVIRFGVYNYLCWTEVGSDKIITITDPKRIMEMMRYTKTIIQQFNNPKTRGKFLQYRDLVQQKPLEDKDYYADILGVSRQTIWEYDKKMKRVDEI
jgi:hypothetical protein